MVREHGNSCIYPRGCVVEQARQRFEENRKQMNMMMNQIFDLGDPDVEEVNLDALDGIVRENESLANQVRDDACNNCPYLVRQ